MRKAATYLNRKTLAVMAIVLGAAMLPALGSEEDYSAMDLAYVKEMVQEGNLEIMEAEQDVDLARNARQAADEKEYDREASRVETLKNRRYYPEQADIDYEYAGWTRDQVEQAILLEAEEAYFNHLLTEREIELKKAEIQNLQTELEQVKRKLELGRATQYEVETAELLISQAQHALDLLFNEREVLGWDLKQLMNVSLDSTIRFENAAIPEASYDAADLEEDLAALLETHGDIVKADGAYELALELVDIMDDADVDNDDAQYLNAEDGVAVAETAAAAARRDVEYAVRSGWNALLNAEDAWEVARLETEKAKIQLDILQRKEELGMATALEVSKAQQAYDQALLEADRAKLEVHKANRTFLDQFE